MSEKKRFKDLKVGDEFMESELIIDEGEIDISIVGDHVYTVTDKTSRVIVAFDMHPGTGQVISVTDYS